MADKIPVKARYSGSDVISLGELETGDTINASYISNLPAGLPATGADGNVLTSDGTNWASEAAGGGAWKLLSTTTTSGTPSTVEITADITSTYKVYKIIFYRLQWSAGGTSYIRFSTNGGSSWDTTNNYSYHVDKSSSAYEEYRMDLASAGGILIFNYMRVGTSPSPSWHQGELTLWDPASSDSVTWLGIKTFTVDPSLSTGNSTGGQQQIGHGSYDLHGAVNAIQFYNASGGTCVAGSVWKLYGLV